jgi:hypothetical protein
MFGLFINFQVHFITLQYTAIKHRNKPVSATALSLASKYTVQQLRKGFLRIVTSQLRRASNLSFLSFKWKKKRTVLSLHDVFEIGAENTPTARQEKFVNVVHRINIFPSYSLYTSFNLNKLSSVL